jgi:ADP-L-glycero-D-manno-heptose 6-epimerase
MIIITGAAGFIASAMAAALNVEGYYDLVLVDDFSRPDRRSNYASKRYSALVERSQFFVWLRENHRYVQFVVHLGARTDTTEFNHAIFDELNVRYSQNVWNACVEYGLPLIYASSAATYGDGSMGYSDDHNYPPLLQPLNPYGESKNEFDKWVLTQEKQPFFWAGLKFFNVYGPNEYHKGRMASVVMHSHRQILETGGVRLFRSHNPRYADGGQMRDFVYVKDLAKVMIYLMEQRPASGIYNMGTGVARTFEDLARAVFAAMGRSPDITYIDIPLDIRDKYQYYTQADMGKLRRVGYTQNFYSLEEGVMDYVQNYLAQGGYF